MTRNQASRITYHAFSRYVLGSTLYVFVLLLCAAPTFAQPAPSPADPIPAMIRSQDPAKQKQAVALIRTQMDRDGRNLDGYLVRTWMDALRDAKLSAEATEIIDRGIPLLSGRQNWMVVRLMAHRAEFTLAQGKKEGALAFLQQGLKLEAANGIEVLDELRLYEPLVRAGLLQETIDAVDQATIACAGDAIYLERPLAIRAQAYLAAGQPQQALASAKSLYNVSRMEGTANALRILTKCLQAAYPQDRDLIIRFRDEQLAGASPATTQPSAAKSSVLSAIKVDGAVYEKPLGKDLVPSPIEEDFATLTRMGNLLLLADRPEDAKPCFEQAYRFCNAEQLPAATESLARVMKAQDGTIRRANAFLLALRPTKSTAK